MDLDNKINYTYFDNQVIKNLNDYFDRKYNLVLEKLETLDYKNNLKNTYHYHNVKDINSLDTEYPLRTNLTLINEQKLDSFIENDVLILNYLLKNNLNQNVLNHLDIKMFTIRIKRN